MFSSAKSRVGGAAAVAALAVTTVIGAGAPATAAAAWPTPSGSQAVGQTIKVTGGTYDGGLKRFYGTGDLGTGGQDEDQGPIFELANGSHPEERRPRQPGRRRRALPRHLHAAQRLVGGRRRGRRHLQGHLGVADA